MSGNSHLICVTYSDVRILFLDLGTVFLAEKHETGQGLLGPTCGLLGLSNKKATKIRSGQQRRQRTQHRRHLGCFISRQNSCKSAVAPHDLPTWAWILRLSWPLFRSFDDFCLAGLVKLWSQLLAASSSSSRSFEKHMILIFSLSCWSEFKMGKKGVFSSTIIEFPLPPN
jgi:hypothetical protein